MVIMSTHNIYLLDTCICIALLKKSPSVIQRLREVGTHNCKISDITLAELYLVHSSLAKKSISTMLLKSPSFLIDILYSIPANTEKYAGNLKSKASVLATWICSSQPQLLKKMSFW